MIVEAMAALLLGLVVLGLVLQPVFRSGPQKVRPAEPIDPEETPKGIALTALKEIEFDRETGKLSDADYEFLKAKYTAAALEALKQESDKEGLDDVEAIVAAKVRALRSAPAATSSIPTGFFQVPAASCLHCGLRPESDALFCSACGCRLPPQSMCHGCGAELTPNSRFCEVCGQQVAA